MITDTTLLLRLYWKIDRRADGGTRRASRLVALLGTLLLVIVSAVIGYLASTLVSGVFLIQIPAEVLPGIMFTVILFGVIFLGFSQALQALYLSDDMEKLQVAPLHPQAIMTAKLLSRMPSTISFMFLAAIPALVAFGIGLGLGWAFYILGVLLVLITPLFGISVGALIAIFMVRLLPARRLNEWVGAASIVIGLLLSMIFAIPSMMGGGQTQIDQDILRSAETFLAHLAELPLPSMWVGRALVEFGKGQMVASAFGSLGTYLLITVGLFLITVLLANRLYTAGWLRMQSSGAPMEDIHERPGLFGRNSLDFMLGYKDWLLRVRDPRLLATLFSSVVLAVFFLFMAMRPGGDGTSLLTSAPPEDGSLDLLSPGIISSVLVFFLGYMAFTNMAMTALNIERQAFYVLKTAPISASRVFRAKTFGVFIPYAILTTVALAVFWIFLRFSLLWTPFAWIILMIAGYGLYTFLVSLSFLYPKLDWDDPRQMRNRKAGLPMLIGTTVYSLVILILAFGTYALAHGSPIWAIPIVVMGLAIMGGGTWFFVHRITVRVEKSWPSIGIAN